MNNRVCWHCGAVGEAAMRLVEHQDEPLYTAEVRCLDRTACEERALTAKPGEIAEPIEQPAGGGSR